MVELSFQQMEFNYGVFFPHVFPIPTLPLRSIGDEANGIFFPHVFPIPTLPLRNIGEEANCVKRLCRGHDLLGETNGVNKLGSGRILRRTVFDT
jgi:hypothetical protein